MAPTSKAILQGGLYSQRGEAENRIKEARFDLFKRPKHGGHAVRGFNNRDIRSQLTRTRWLRACAGDVKKASAKVDRCFRRLHAHGHIANFTRVQVINCLALKLLTPGGLLLSFSCSRGLGAELFYKIFAGPASDAGFDDAVISRLKGPSDHPTTLALPGSEYLKRAGDSEDLRAKTRAQGEKARVGSFTPLCAGLTVDRGGETC